jgi:hypothetical protein
MLMQRSHNIRLHLHLDHIGDVLMQRPRSPSQQLIASKLLGLH